jgi:hypothetical protein
MKKLDNLDKTRSNYFDSYQETVQGNNLMKNIYNQYIK